MVAQEAGVSVATASFALRGLVKIKPETRKRVMEVALRLGYVRDPQLSNTLAFIRKENKPVYRETLAFFSDTPLAELSSKRWIREMYLAATQRAAELGYGIEYVQYSNSTKTQKAMIRQLQAQGIRGLIFTPRMGVTSFHLGIDLSSFSAVEIGQTMEPAIFPRIIRDVPRDYLNLFKNLNSRGYTRIGLAITDFEEQRHQYVFLSAYLCFQYVHKGDGKNTQLSVLPKYGKRQVLSWIRKEKLDVLIVNGWEIGAWLREAGYIFPRDMGLCRVDATAGDAESGLCPNYADMALNAVNWLITSLEYGNLGIPERPPLLCIPNAWNEGKTLASDT